jgi:hypothetical protein
MNNLLKDNVIASVSSQTSAGDAGNPAVRPGPKAEFLKRRPAVVVDEHTVEIDSDSGEGAQKASQTFGSLCAKMGNGA